MPYLKKILKFVDENVPGELLLLANFILRSPYRKDIEHSGNDMISRLKKIYTFPQHWAIYPSYYWYPGTGKRAQVKMGMFIFVKSQI